MLVTGRIDSLRDHLPDGLAALLADDERAGTRFVRRLVDEWASGANRFDRSGEALFGAWVGEELVGVCGLNIDPYVETGRVGRVRRLYVHTASRRLGVGRGLVLEVIAAARGRFDSLRLRTANPAAARLYETIGFRPSGGTDHTHVMELLTSRQVLVVAYQPRWEDEFARISSRIHDLVGHAAVQIDHIGSTAVPGLGAKDVIDVQISVANLDDAGGITNVLRAAGFRQGESVQYDAFPGRPETDPELRKLFLREPEGERRTHVHVREQGRFNQRYALLFRDYLRASPDVGAAYELLKRRAAQLFPYDIDGYLALKEPMLRVIYEAASLWADKVGWSPVGGEPALRRPGDGASRPRC
jgi:GrpB-like predicted nucleotidyltransferase (UPF0157 family)